MYIEIYFAINICLSSYYLGYELRLNNISIKYILAWVLGLLITIPFGIILGVLLLGKCIYDYLNNHFQVGFFLTFYSKSWSILSNDTLSILNASNKPNSKNIKHKIYSYGLRIINKRNNYKTSL